MYASSLCLCLVCNVCLRWKYEIVMFDTTVDRMVDKFLRILISMSVMVDTNPIKIYLYLNILTTFTRI